MIAEPREHPVRVDVGLGPGHARSSIAADTIAGRGRSRTLSVMTSRVTASAVWTPGKDPTTRRSASEIHELLSAGDRVAAVVEYEHDQVAQAQATELPERAHAHQQVAVSDDRDDADGRALWPPSAVARPHPIAPPR